MGDVSPLERLGFAICRARLDRGLTQTELGVRIGIKKGWMSGIEHGANITLDTLVRICRALGVESKLVIGDEVVELCDCEP